MITKRNLDRESRKTIFGIQILSLAIAHWPKEEWKNIDQRMLFLTVHVPQQDQIEELMNVTYSKVRKVFGFKDKNTEIAMISAGDLKGTRHHAVGLTDDDGPHFHAIVILPNFLVQQHGFDWCHIEREICLSILEIKEIKQLFGLGGLLPVHVERMSFDDRDVFTAIDYVLKAGKNYTQLMGNNSAHLIFPFEQFSIGKREHLNEERVRLNMHLLRESFFQFPQNLTVRPFEEEAIDRFFASKSDVEKQEVFQKLYRLIE
ncbi:hypothetical protein [Celeribacter sp. ULVN23_4]